MLNHFNAITVSITATMFLTMVILVYDSQSSEREITYLGGKMSETKYFQMYEELEAPENTIVVYPIFTQSAYEWGGIHDFFMDRCQSCKTTKLQYSYDDLYSSSGNGYKILEFLGYTIIDDIELDKNPEIIQSFEKVILLHNEYVTQSEFDSIISHPKVIFLYPGAFRSLIEADYFNNTISLIRGPNFPYENITNGFDWKYDNSENISNWDCNNWEFVEIERGTMLNCYPEKLLESDGSDLLNFIKNF